jgi:integral membrane protein (TIGR01906 family)
VTTTLRVEVAIFAIAFALFGLVALALMWSGDWAYAGLANLNGVTKISFLMAPSALDQGRVETPLDLPTVLSWHHAWAAYVTGASSTPAISWGPDPIFSNDESAHMTDVRAVFRGAEFAAALALFVVVYRVARARRRGDALRLVRAGAVTAAGIVTVIGIAAAVAFDPLFLLFHEAFFPQGNFLFDPATSNLIRLYPEWYWQGITTGVGLSFIAVAILVAGAAHIALGRRSNTYTRAA